MCVFHEKHKMLNSSAFSIMNRKHKTIFNKCTKNCNKNDFKSMLGEVGREDERKETQEGPQPSSSSVTVRPLYFRCPPQICPVSLFSVVQCSLLPLSPPAPLTWWAPSPSLRKWKPRTNPLPLQKHSPCSWSLYPEFPLEYQHILLYVFPLSS